MGHPAGPAGGGRPGRGVPGRHGRSRPDRRRVGLRPDSRAPMREGVELYADGDGDPVGRVTSGGFGPSLDAPVAMGYVPIALAAPETRLSGQLRGKMLAATVVKMPFITPGYKR